MPESANAPGVLAYERPEGTLLTTDVRKARTFADARSVDDTLMARLLGYPETKSDVLATGAPHVVQGRDAAGNVVAADVKTSSGFPVLDRATVEFIRRHWRLPTDGSTRHFETSITYKLLMN